LLIILLVIRAEFDLRQPNISFQAFSDNDNSKLRCLRRSMQRWKVPWQNNVDIIWCFTTCIAAQDLPDTFDEELELMSQGGGDAH
jgi:hypothetical protein